MFIEKCVFNLVLVNQPLDWVKGKARKHISNEASALNHKLWSLSFFATLGGREGMERETEKTKNKSGIKQKM